MKTPYVVPVLLLLTAIVFALTPASAQNPNSRRVTPLSAELAFGAISATGPTGANTVYTFTEDCGIVGFENTTNVEIDVLIGSTKKRIPTASFRVFDLVADYTRWASGTIVKAFYPGSAPTSGVIEVFCNPQ